MAVAIEIRRSQDSLTTSMEVNVGSHVAPSLLDLDFFESTFTTEKNLLCIAIDMTESLENLSCSSTPVKVATAFEIISPALKTEKSVDELFDELQSKTAELTINFCTNNQLEHRFHDILCPKETVVKLNGKFLHANTVKIEGCNMNFVASQAPTHFSKSLFWQMVSQGDYTIFDLTTPKDYDAKTKSPAIHYSPAAEEPFKTFGLEVQFESAQESLYTYKVSQGEQSKTIQRFHFPDWPDHGSVSVEQLTNLVDAIEKTKNKNIWVHCRAGVGRSLTLIATRIVKDKIVQGEITKENLDEALIELILKLREQRGPVSVQTQAQFACIRDYAKSLLS